MIEIKKFERLYIQVLTSDRHELSTIKEYFTAYVDGFRFMPAYQDGRWDGRVSLFNGINRTIPYGLLTDLLACVKKNNFDLKVDPDVIGLFKLIKEPKITENLSILPRDYQEDCILTLLKYGKGIIRSTTGSGKSLIIAYIINELKRLGKIKKSLIIVPTTSLVLQFYNDLIEYGFDEKNLGRVYEKYKEFEPPIVISTWQSLMRRHTVLPMFDSFFCDEVHINKANGNEVKKILSCCTNAFIRTGFTGTLPENKLEILNVKSFIGPVLKEYLAADLAEKGYISTCNVHAINIKYDLKYSGEYNDIKDAVFQNTFRLDLIKHIIKIINGNVLVLVGKVEKEGKLLKEYLSIHSDIGREIVFIYGKTKVEEREFWRKELEVRKNIVLIATYPIIQMGVNIPSLKYIIFAAPFKSKIRILQSVGRSLRLHAEKINGSHVFDLIDNCKHLYQHGDKRVRYYYTEGFKVNEYNIKENDDLQSLIDKDKIM
jgi:superfamily II DNA or RNA helicase